MAAEHIEPGKPSEACVEVHRVLEKCIRESKCVDLESLCIVAEEKVSLLTLFLPSRFCLMEYCGEKLP